MGAILAVPLTIVMRIVASYMVDHGYGMPFSQFLVNCLAGRQRAIFPSLTDMSGVLDERCPR